MSTQTTAKAPTLKQKIEALDDLQFTTDPEAFKDYWSATRASVGYEVAISRAASMAAMGTALTLTAAFMANGLVKDLNAQKDFVPATTEAGITAKTNNQHLSNIISLSLDKLEPPSVTVTSNPEYAGNGQFITPAKKIEERVTPITTAQFNDAVQHELKLNAMFNGLVTLLELGSAGFVGTQAYGFLKTMRRDRKEIERVFDKHIDTTKVQPLQTGPSGPGFNHGK